MRRPTPTPGARKAVPPPRAPTQRAPSVLPPPPPPTPDAPRPPKALPLPGPPGRLATHLAGAHAVPVFVTASALALQSAVDASGLAPSFPPGAAAGAGAALAALYAGVHALAGETAWARPAEPLRVVITGASRGLGKALARSFALAGDAVVMVGRDAAGLAAAAADVRAACGGEEGGGGGVTTVVADVSDTRRAASLVDAAFGAAPGGEVDLWINNAGEGVWCVVCAGT